MIYDKMNVVMCNTYFIFSYTAALAQLNGILCQRTGRLPSKLSLLSRTENSATRLNRFSNRNFIDSMSPSFFVVKVELAQRLFAERVAELFSNSALINIMALERSFII